uniref:Armadillo repeat-containing protein 6 n=2 Tax=Timema TaxID=61471 RepID=A0A7R9CI96_TIMPO|nr:unnamed protein product [Timema douglasi]CAD7396268.1 unnamed protein product [Timema poppensis]
MGTQKHKNIMVTLGHRDTRIPWEHGDMEITRVPFILTSLCCVHISSMFQRLTRQCLTLVKSLAGDDDVKARMGTAGIAPLIVLAMNNHKQSASLAATASACMAAITLRSPANSKSLIEAGAAEAILETMKTHQNDTIVQKQCSWAIRNIVSRDRSLNNTFLSLGAEELLQEALKRHGSNCEYDIKSALRDLECEVELIERWTGKGGALN